MRAANPPRQMERENEIIVISHRLFLMGMGISPFTSGFLEDRDGKSTRLDKPTSRKDPYEMYEIS